MDKVKEKLQLSPITLGNMRFSDKGLTQKEALQLLESSWDIGINCHHSSYEYNSYDLYKDALQKTTFKKNIKHIVKLSSPHFEDTEFSPKILENRIDTQLKNLQIDCIDVLQWLVRSKPINDIARLQILSEKKEEIDETISELNKKGKIKTTFSFPYSLPFAREVINFQQIDGIISYLNKEELDYASFAKEGPFIAIRPLFAGKLIKESKKTKEEIILEQLNFVGNHKNVITTIVGINSIEQLKVYKKYLG